MLKWEDVTRMATHLKGVPVLGCLPGGPAALAGMQYGDILIAVNGVSTPDWDAYIEARARGHGKMQVELFRAGETLAFELALPAPAEPIDPPALLDELIESGLFPLADRDPSRDPEPS